MACTTNTNLNVDIILQLSQESITALETELEALTSNRATLTNDIEGVAQLINVNQISNVFQLRACRVEWLHPDVGRGGAGHERQGAEHEAAAAGPTAAI